MRRFTLILLALVALPLSCPAKHIKPRLTPVEIDGWRFTAPNDQSFRGYIIAENITNETDHWERTIYHVLWRFPLPEIDLYYCVITQLKAHDGQLLIKNDRAKWYSLDPKTRKVKRITEEQAEKESGQPTP